MRIFNTVEFNRNTESGNKVIQDSRWQFFVPGVNSGIYKPATLHARVRINEKEAGFFKFKENFKYADITLSQEEFDQLFEEIKKIKALQDSLKSV